MSANIIANRNDGWNVDKVDDG